MSLVVESRHNALLARTRYDRQHIDRKEEDLKGVANGDDCSMVSSLGSLPSLLLTGPEHTTFFDKFQSHQSPPPKSPARIQLRPSCDSDLSPMTPNFHTMKEVGSTSTHRHFMSSPYISTSSSLFNTTLESPSPAGRPSRPRLRSRRGIMRSRNRRYSLTSGRSATGSSFGSPSNMTRYSGSSSQRRLRSSKVVSNNTLKKRVTFDLPDELLSAANSSTRSARSLPFCELETQRDSCGQDGEDNDYINNNRGCRRLVLPFINNLDSDEDYDIELGEEGSYLQVDIEWDSSSDGERDDKPSYVEDDIYLVAEAVQSPSYSVTSIRSREQSSPREHCSDRSCHSTESSSSTIIRRGLTPIHTPSCQKLYMLPYLDEYDNVIATPLPFTAETPHIIPFNNENDGEFSIGVELPPITPFQEEKVLSNKESPTSVMVHALDGLY